MQLSSVGSWQQASTSSDSDEGSSLPYPLRRQESSITNLQVDELVNGMKGMSVVQKSEPPPLPPRRVANFDNPPAIPDRKYTCTFQQNKELLNKYLELLGRATRHTLRSTLPKLSFEGRNVLHYVAFETDFSEYKAVIAKHCSQKDFCQLVLEQSTEDFLTPVHVICQRVNVEMLKCLLASKNERMKESLKRSGAFIDNHQRTLLHCLGDGLIEGYKAAQKSVEQERLLRDPSQQFGFLDEKIVELRKSNDAFKKKSVELLELLEKLYGSKELGDLIETKDCEGDTIMSLATRAHRQDIVEIVCEIKIRGLKA